MNLQANPFAPAPGIPINTTIELNRFAVVGMRGEVRSGGGVRGLKRFQRHLLKIENCAWHN
jgi:hypothetical protein